MQNNSPFQSGNFVFGPNGPPPPNNTVGNFVFVPGGFLSRNAIFGNLPLPPGRGDQPGDFQITQTVQRDSIRDRSRQTRAPLRRSNAFAEIPMEMEDSEFKVPETPSKKRPRSDDDYEPLESQPKRISPDQKPIPSLEKTKIERLLAANKAYYDSPSFKASSFIGGKFPELNDDVLSEIGKYMGKNFGLLNRSLRTNWIKSGITANYDHVAKMVFPEYLAEYVTKISVDFYTPNESVLNLFPNLKEVQICRKEKHTVESMKTLLKPFEKIEKIIIDEETARFLTWRRADTVVALKNIYVMVGSDLVLYSDYSEMREKTADRSLVALLERDGKLNLEEETVYNVLFSDLPLIYLYLSKRIVSFPKRVPRISLSVMINNDSTQIDFYLRVFKKLFEDMDVKIELDIYGKRSNCYSKFGSGKPLPFSASSLFDSLMRFDNFKLSTLIKTNIDNYLAIEEHKKEKM